MEGLETLELPQVYGDAAAGDADMWLSGEEERMFMYGSSTDSGRVESASAAPPVSLEKPNEAEGQSGAGHPKRLPAMPAVDCGARGSAPLIEWADIALLVEGGGPLFSTAMNEREHIVTDLEQPRRIFVERLRARRKPGGDKWLNSGGNKGSIVAQVRPGFALRKRYGKVLSATRPDASLRYAEFTIVSCSHDDPVVGKSSVAVFVLDTVTDESSRRGSPVSPRSSKAENGGGAAAEVRSSATSMTPRPQVYRGSADAASSGAAVLDLVQIHGSKFMSFQAQDGGKAIELGVIEKGGNGIRLSSAQGDFAEWHRRVPQEPPFCEGDVVGFTTRGEITRRCTASGSMMLGVVTRRAVVEGSAPPVAERNLYDTVAYMGVVPVRVVHGGVDLVDPGVPALNACMAQCNRQTIGPRAGDILVPSGRCDGTAVAISVQDLPAGSSLAARRVGVVLASCDWNSSDKQMDDTAQLVEAAIAPPVSTVAASTQISVRATFSVLTALFVAVGIVMVARLLLQLSPGGQDGGVSAASCCCTQPGRGLTDCGALCSCSESCKRLCPEPWDPQCKLPYTYLSDSFRGVEHLTGWPLNFRGHADAPLRGTDDFKALCPTSPERADYSTKENKYYESTGVGGGRWYRFVGAAGDGLPLYPPPEWHCGTANGGWLSGYNRTAHNGTAPPPHHHHSGSTCARDSALYANCSSCLPGSSIDGGVEAVGGLCRAHCNTFGFSKTGFCGTSDAYVKDGLDCTPCRNWVPGAESEFSDGPPVDYAEPGRYPTAAEGKVAMWVCFSAGVACPSQTNTACGGSTCWRHQAIHAVQCDGFYLWQLFHVPYCRSGFCTVNTSTAAENLGSTRNS